jgi:hypothetical protein
VTDQDGLYTPAEFANPNLYPPGYHWRVDRLFVSDDLTSAQAVESGSGWSLFLGFNPSGASRINVETRSASNNPPGSAASRIGFFAGSHVFAAPVVSSALSNAVSIELPSALTALDVNDLIAQIC